MSIVQPSLHSSTSIESLSASGPQTSSPAAVLPSPQASPTAPVESSSSSHSRASSTPPPQDQQQSASPIQSNDRKTPQHTASARRRDRKPTKPRDRPRQPTSFLHPIRNAGRNLFKKKKSHDPSKTEQEKSVIVKSHRATTSNLLIHIFPICVSVFLIGLNAAVFVNGPEISTLAQYALQGASKFHELAIVASLARILLDLLRYHLVYKNVQFGMLSSPFTFIGLDYLWSKEFRAPVATYWNQATKSIRAAYTNSRQKTTREPLVSNRQQTRKTPFLELVHQTFETKLFFFVVAAIFCLLAAIVGPASALLFLPSQAWLSAGSTNINLFGTPDQLWPQHLTQNHAGPEGCDRGDPGNYWCLQGGWDIMDGIVTPVGITRRETYIYDGGVPRAIWLWRESDSWATTLHGATAALAGKLNKDHDHAWKWATGKVRRIRDAGHSGAHVRVIAPMAFVRVLCAPIKPVNDTSPTLLFPVLESKESWRDEKDERSFGRSKEMKMNGTYKSLVNARWTVLPSDFGTSTAGLAYVTNNDTTAAGCGCSVDARWATGQSLLQGQTQNWQAFMGPPGLPTALKFPSVQKMPFSHHTIQDNVGATITSDPEWLKHLSFPIQEQGSRRGPTNYTALEILLMSTRLWDMKWVLEDSFAPIQELESVLALYFVNAVSRIGWDLQKTPNGTDLNALLTAGSTDEDRILLDNSSIGQLSKDDTIQHLKMNWFLYATAWQLNDSALYISVVILSLHIFIALVHTVTLLRIGKAFKAWTSISDLLALTQLSTPSVNEMKNCGAGVALKETLLQRFRVVVVAGGGGGGEERVQLVSAGFGGSGAVMGNDCVEIDGKYS